MLKVMFDEENSLAPAPGVKVEAVAAFFAAVLLSVRRNITF
jgi:hypothetical protein